MTDKVILLIIQIASMHLFKFHKKSGRSRFPKTQTQNPKSGSQSALLRPSPLRTVRASFPAYGSSLYETLERAGFVTEMC